MPNFDEIAKIIVEKWDLLAAITSYDEALKIKPDLHEAWDNRGTTLAELGRYEDAIGLLTILFDSDLYLPKAGRALSVGLGDVRRATPAIAV